MGAVFNYWEDVWVLDDCMNRDIPSLSFTIGGREGRKEGGREGGRERGREGREGEGREGRRVDLGRSRACWPSYRTF
jgi:hypothetical protein